MSGERPPSLRDSYGALHQIPIETLDLSEKALRVLKWHGITTIGECVAFYIQDAHHLASSSKRLSPFMYGELEPRMKALGYWEYVMSPEIWQHLHPYHFQFSGKVVTWQGQNLNLDDISMDELGLSEVISKSVRGMRIISLGECIYHIILYIHACHSTSHFSESLIQIAKIAYTPEKVLMFERLEQALKEKGYWRFVEENLDD